MTKSILVTRPDHEIVTKYCSVWSEDVVTLAKSKAMDVYDLKGKKAVRKEFESYIRSQMPSLIFLNGHGNGQLVTGQNDEPLLDDSAPVNDSILYARSCDAAQELGPALVRRGARAFIGYQRKFTLFYDPAFVTKPHKDPMARRFMESSNLVVSTLIKDHTADEADQRAKDAMLRHLKAMLSSEATFEERYAAPAMWNNMAVQVVLGNGNARI
jgi:hypothetical protein